MANQHQIDPQSTTWFAIKTWAAERMTQHRAITEAHGMSMEETEYARGALAELKILLNLTEPRSMPRQEQTYEP